MHDDANQFVLTAQAIRRAKFSAPMATELVRASVSGPPESRKDWRTRIAVRTACATLLRRLEIAHLPLRGTSPELASDMQLDIRAKIASLLTAIMKQDDAKERAMQLAGVAVSALTNAAPRLGEQTEEARQIIAGLNGEVFISAGAREYAQKLGIEQAELDEAVATVIQPLRVACKTNDVWRIGQLRYSKGLTKDITLCATVEGMDDEMHGPLIQVRILDAKAPPPTKPGHYQELETNYGARLMRQFIS